MKGKINTILVGAGSPSEDDVKKMFGWSAHKFGQVGNLPDVPTKADVRYTNP